MRSRSRRAPTRRPPAGRGSARPACSSRPASRTRRCRCFRPATPRAKTTRRSARALEGLGIALEAAGKADDAQKRFEELKGFDDGSHKDLAEYHLARLKLAKGDRDGAKTILKEVYDRLNAPAEGAPRSRFLKGEVEARLAELDSSLVPAGGSEAQQFSQEEIQRLIQQLQQQKGGALPTGE